MHLAACMYIYSFGLAPMHGTITDFWRLVWQEKVQNIAMLTNLMEGRQRKCERYWPESGSEEYGPFMVNLIEEQVFADYTIRTMHLVVCITLKLNYSEYAVFTCIKDYFLQFHHNSLGRNSRLIIDIMQASKPGGGPNLRKVTQFHFTTWPDHGVPEYAGPLLQYLRRIKTLHKPKRGPLLVHCRLEPKIINLNTIVELFSVAIFYNYLVIQF